MQLLALSCTVVVALAAVHGTAGAAPTAPGAPHANPAPRKKGPTLPDKVVDINSASTSELMTLPGIGAADAARIVANRPYLSKTDLVTKNVLPTGPFISLKRHVVALQDKGRPTQPARQHKQGTAR